VRRTPRVMLSGAKHLGRRETRLIDAEILRPAGSE
jgi:hypothetical protein